MALHEGASGRRECRARSFARSAPEQSRWSNLLQQEKFELAKAVLDFATEVLKTYSSEEFRLRFVVNRAQAYKWSGDNERALEILKAEDFYALSDVFKLAAAVLREDYKQALALVKLIGAQGEIRLEDYREWPLFKEFRKQRELEVLIAKIFKEPLNRIDVKDGLRLPNGQADLASLTANAADRNGPVQRRGLNSRKTRRDETQSLLPVSAEN